MENGKRMEGDGVLFLFLIFPGEWELGNMRVLKKPALLPGRMWYSVDGARHYHHLLSGPYLWIGHTGKAFCYVRKVQGYFTAPLYQIVLGRKLIALLWDFVCYYGITGKYGGGAESE